MTTPTQRDTQEDTYFVSIGETPSEPGPYVFYVNFRDEQYLHSDGETDFVMGYADARLYCETLNVENLEQELNDLKEMAGYLMGNNDVEYCKRVKNIAEVRAELSWRYKLMGELTKKMDDYCQDSKYISIWSCRDTSDKELVKAGTFIQMDRYPDEHVVTTGDMELRDALILIEKQIGVTKDWTLFVEFVDFDGPDTTFIMGT